MLQDFAIKCLIIVIIFQFNRATSESLKPSIFMTKTFVLQRHVKLHL